MNQAQGAIDAARAAGAEQYASTELAAAIDSLARSEEAIAQNDYRLALTLALDSRARAQAAVKSAVEARTKARGTAERLLAEVETLLTQAHERLEDPAVTKLPRRVLQNSTESVAMVEKSMQEARAALKADDYARAISAAEGLAARLRAALKGLGDGGAAAGTKRRR